MLRTLGALCVVGTLPGDRGTALAELNARPRTLAVLLRLAIADAPVSRDLLTEEFWGDRDPERARHSLADALSAIRRVFGRDSISLRSPQLVFRPDPRLVVDAQEFARAVTAGRDVDAVQWYQGAFLDGVFVDRAARFDQWAMRRRFEFREQFVAAAAREHGRLMTTGAWPTAAALAMRWQAESPLEAAPTRAVLEALAGPGTATALRRALDTWQEHLQALAAEDETPDDALAAYAGTLQERYAAMPTVPTPAPMDATPRQTPSPAGADATRRPAEPPVSARRRTRWLTVAALLAAAGLGTAALAASQRNEAAELPWVVVADVDAAGVDTMTRDAFGLATRTALAAESRLLVLPDTRARELAALSAPDAVRLDERLGAAVARRAGATAVIVPVLVRTGSQYRPAVRVIGTVGTSNDQIVQGPMVSGDSLLPALDRLIGPVRDAVQGRRASGPPPSPLPDLATRSLPALAAYARGAAALRRGQYREALAGLQETVALDSTLAQAHLALGRALLLLNQPAKAESAFVRADRWSKTLGERDRMSIQATIATAHGDHSRSIALYREWLTRWPDDRVTRFQLGYAAFSARRNREAIDAYREVVRVDSLDAGAWIELGKAWNAHDVPGAKDSAAAAYARGLRLVPTRLNDVLFIQGYGRLLVEIGRPDSAATIFRLLTTRDSSLAGRGYRWLGMLALWDGRPGAAISELERALALQTTESLSALRTQWLLAVAAEAAGQTETHARTLDAMLALIREDIAEPRALWWTGSLLARSGRTRDAERVLDTLRARMVPTMPSHRAAMLALQAEVAAASGRGKRAVSLARMALTADSSELTVEALAMAQWRAGMTDSAVARLRTAAADKPAFGWEGGMVLRLLATERATIAEASGDTAEARRIRTEALRRFPRAEPSFRRWLETGRAPGVVATSGRRGP